MFVTWSFSLAISHLHFVFFLNTTNTYSIYTLTTAMAFKRKKKHSPRLALYYFLRCCLGRETYEITLYHVVFSSLNSILNLSFFRSIPLSISRNVFVHLSLSWRFVYSVAGCCCCCCRCCFFHCVNRSNTVFYSAHRHWVMPWATLFNIIRMCVHINV